MLKEEEIKLLIDILSKIELTDEKENKLLNKLQLFNQRIDTINILKSIDLNLDKLDEPIEK